ncbi:MAG: TetR/AcrR family transcriptional regulator [Desulforegulaceae bacterium]|nr:TetR/AcrR family transcriptional regulator [Desulforegulaceae bacterium]
MKKNIIKSASKLFTEKGVEKTSLAEISSKAKISKGTLYYHFSTKNDLVFAVTEMHMEKITQNLLNLLNTGDPPEEIVGKLFETVPDSITRSRLHIYLVREAVTEKGELLDKFRYIYGRWKKMLVRGLNEVVPDLRDPDALASFFIAAVDGLVIQNLLSINEVSSKRYVELIKILFKNTKGEEDVRI